MLQQRGKYDQVEPLFLDFIAKLKHNDSLGAFHANTLVPITSLAVLYWGQGRLDKAALYTDCLAKSKDIHGDNHLTSRTVWHCSTLNRVSLTRLRHALFLDCLSKQRWVVIGDSHPSTLETVIILAGLYWSRGQFDKAEPLFAEYLAKRITALGDNHPILSHR